MFIGQKTQHPGNGAGITELKFVIGKKSVIGRKDIKHSFPFSTSLIISINFVQ
jgi:hypothetical protein